MTTTGAKYREGKGTHGAGALTAVFRRVCAGGSILSRRGAQSLILWTYKADSDPSFLAPYLMPVWTKWADFLPEKVSPNVISLSGFLVVFLMFLYVQFLTGGSTGWDIPDSDSTALPWWFFLAAAAVIWTYQTADAMDGRQGKRVSMYAHPSTELFDHGVDSTMPSLLGITMAAALRLGHSEWTALFVLSSWTIFYSSTWEHLYTGRLRFQTGLSNPTESLIVIIVMCFGSVVFPTIWEVRLGELIALVVKPDGYFPSFLLALPVKHALVVVQLINGISALVSSILQVWQTPRPHSSTIAATALPSLGPLALIWVWTILAFWIHNYLPIPTLTQHGRLLLYLGAFTWTYSALMLVICEMSKTKYPAQEVIRTTFLLLFIPIVLLLLYQGAYAIILVKGVVLVAGIRYLHLWLQFLREIVHYCGMASWYSIQPWTDSVPNVARLNDRVEFLGAGGGDISEWGAAKGIQQSRIEALMSGEIVELWD